MTNTKHYDQYVFTSSVADVIKSRGDIWRDYSIVLVQGSADNRGVHTSFRGVQEQALENLVEDARSKNCTLVGDLTPDHVVNGNILHACYKGTGLVKKT